ncbi:MAG: CorA family divalent cation transporter [Acetobacteraceae bacterium]|nr:magnesium transporter [Pseudomonadota bacterium]
MRVPGHDGQPDWDWWHYDLVNGQARRALEHHPALPEFAQSILLGTDETPRILEDDGVIAGVMPAFARTGDAEEFTVSAWHFALAQHALITGRRSASRSLVHMWEAVRRGDGPTGPGDLVERCIVDFARAARSHLATLAAKLEPIEDVLLEPRDSAGLADIGRKLGAVRREATRLQRVLTPLARTLDDEDEELPLWAGLTEHNISLRLVNAALDDIAALNDRARSLQDELTTRLTEETNRRLYIVSVVTTLIVPGTFITGFFGMNTGGMLWAGEGMRYGTLYATMLCVGAILATMLWLKWKRLL